MSIALITQFLLSNWKAFAAVGAFVIFELWVYHLGGNAVKREWTASIVAAQLAVAQKERDNQLISNGVSHAYQTNIAAIDALYSTAVDGVHTAPSSNLPSVSLPTTGHNAAPVCNRLSNADKITLLKLTRAAQIQTARLVYCQNWITEQQHNNQ